MMRKALSLLILCFLISNPYTPSPVFAQDLSVPEPDQGLDITISPPILDLRTEPGASISAVIRIKNDSNTQPELLRIDLMKFKADETGSKPVLVDLGPGDLFPQWLNFSETTFIVEPQTWKNITLTFTPPANAAPAYYFAVVFNRDKEVKITEGQLAHGAAAVLVLSQISSSRVYHQLDLQQLANGAGFGFKTDRYFYEFLPVNFTTTLVNNGNVHELAYGNIFLDWVTGGKRDLEMLDVNKEKSFILPQSTRSFTTSWTNGFPHWEDQKDDAGNPVLNKQGKVKQKLVWDFAKIPTLRIGKYRATLVLVYNDGVRDIPLEAATEFWVIPWRILLALVVVIILIVIGLKGTIQTAYDKFKTARERKRLKI